MMPRAKDLRKGLAKQLQPVYSSLMRCPSVARETEMKAGAKITVNWLRPEGDVAERATVARTTRQMLPLPVGYVPVRFATGGVLLVHASRVSQEAA